MTPFRAATCASPYCDVRLRRYDPPQDIVVIRDLAWYVLGSDYITPEFSHHLLALAERHGFHEDGKLTEFIHANEELPELHDYKPNIIVDTALYVYTLYHYALLCKENPCRAPCAGAPLLSILLARDSGRFLCWKPFRKERRA